MECIEDEDAIIVRGAYKRYGGQNSSMTLNSLDMTLKKGTIYGLLGPSGCGKTTLLGSIVGCKKIQGGMISVFGNSPGTSNAKSIGYMPQETALQGEFTVKGALEHFGWIFGMTNRQIDEKHAFLEKLLDLPRANKMVKNLSGGQQRRVSLAVSLVHDPQLLILDEPTVGLDPILRQNIWDYLIKLTEEKKTIIITTHYIEEARQAHTVGLMRNGKIIAEGEPQSLLHRFDCTTLEDVFLLVSRAQTQETCSVNIETNKINDRDKKPLQILESKKPKKTLWQEICFTNKGHAKALLTKNLLRFRRHPGSLGIAFFLPILQMTLMFLAIGVMPSDIKIGIINEELGNYTSCKEYSKFNRVGGYRGKDQLSCNYCGLGCKFVDNLGDELQNQIYFKTQEEAMNEAKKGRIHHVIHFPSNYSQMVALVRENPRRLTADDFMLSQINIYQDVFDYTLSIFVQKELLNTFKRYQESLAVDCNTSIHAEKWPIVFNDPIYGSEDLTYRDFTAPGLIIAGSLFLSMATTSVTIAGEKAEGIWERTTIAGVTSTEILIFHMIVHSLIGFVQVLESFVVSFMIFRLSCKGSLLLAFSLAFMQLIDGICIGILISSIISDIRGAISASLGLFLPFMVMSGSMWPLEGMPDFLRYLSYMIPVTISTESMTNIIHKGWGFTHFHVFKGFLTCTGFILAFTFLSIIVLKYKNS